MFKRPYNLRNLSLLAGPLLLWLTACGPRQHLHTGPLKTDEIHIDRGTTERANIELNLGSGELNLDSGGDPLLAGDLQFNAPELEPQVRTSNNGSHAALTIRQPSVNGIDGNGKNVWNLHMNAKVLWDIAVNCGAGQARLDLHALDLRSLEVHFGAGQVDVNLEGSPKRDYDVNISGGVGQATVRLPKNVGIRAEAHGGLGSIDVTGLEKQGDHYQNSLYDKSKVNVNIRVDGGIGEIRLIG